MPMVSNPTAGDVHVNTPLTNFSQKYIQAQANFASLDAMPNNPSLKQGDLYYEFDRADFFRDEAQIRADGTESAGAGFSLSTSPYFAEVFAFHKDVTDRQRANADSQVRLDQSASQFVSLKMMIKREVEFMATFHATSTWTGSTTGGDIDATWGAAASTPIQQIRDEARSIQSKTGFRPNKMLFGRQAWDTLMDNDDILARVTGGSTVAQPAQVRMNLVAQLFEVDRIWVSDAVVNSANEGATEATDFIAGDNVLLYYAPDAMSLDEPTAGAQFSWTGFTGATTNGHRIKRFRRESLSADRIEGEMAFDYKVTAPELGAYFIDVSDVS